MTLREQLIIVTDAYCGFAGIGRKRLSTLLFNDGKRLDGVAVHGRDLTTGTYEAAMAWLSANWPVDADWPAGVARLSLSGAAAEPSGEATE